MKYETRGELLKRIANQKAYVAELIEERNDLRRRLAVLDGLRTENARLRERLSSLTQDDGESARRLVNALRGFRAAVRGDDGEFIGGAIRRRILADADDLAVEALQPWA